MNSFGRIPLEGSEGESGTTLSFPNGETFTRLRLMSGEGSSGLVYEGLVRSNEGDFASTVIIKECYPADLACFLERTDAGSLQITDEAPAYAAELFAKSKERFRGAYRVQRRFYDEVMARHTSPPEKCLEANGTLYSFVKAFGGQTLDRAYRGMGSATTAINVLVKLVEILDKYHRAEGGGYAHLDVKPQNVFVVQELEGDESDDVVLFDFDTVTRLDELGDPGTEVYASGDWSSYEQTHASRRHLVGARSDWYSVGALLFWMLWGRPPRAVEVIEAYGGWRFVDEDGISPRFRNADPRAISRARMILDRTVTTDVARRYPADEVGAREFVADLERLRDCVDEAKTFINTRMHAPGHVENFLGRNRELAALEEMLCESRVAYVTGDAGIGKTALAQEIARRAETRYDTILFLVYGHSLKATIAGLSVCRPERPACDLDKRYEENLKVLSRYDRTLVVVDNFDVDDDGEPAFREADTLKRFINVVLRGDGNGLAFTSQHEWEWDWVRKYGKPLELGAIDDKGALRNLLLQNGENDDSETSAADEIIDHVEGNTELLLLYGGLMRASYMQPAELLEAVLAQEEYASEDLIDTMKGGSSTFASHVERILRLSELTPGQVHVLQNMALVPAGGIEPRTFMEWCGLHTMNDFNSLRTRHLIVPAAKRGNYMMRGFVGDSIVNLLGVSVDACRTYLQHLTTYCFLANHRSDEWSELARLDVGFWDDLRDYADLGYAALRRFWSSLDSIDSVFPDDAPSRPASLASNTAALYYKLGNVDVAVEIADRYVSQLTATKEPSSALEFLACALKASESNDFETSDGLLERAVEATRLDDVADRWLASKAIWVRARNARGRGDTALASGLYESAIELLGSDGYPTEQVVIEYASMLKGSGETRRAIAVISDALNFNGERGRVNRNCSELLNLQAELYHSSMNYRLADEALRRSLAILEHEAMPADPLVADAKLLLAVNQMQWDAMQAAINRWTEIASDPHFKGDPNGPAAQRLVNRKALESIRLSPACRELVEDALAIYESLDGKERELQAERARSILTAHRGDSPHSSSVE